MNHTTLREEIESLLGTVDEVMERSVLTLRPDLSIGQAAKELEHRGVSGAPVVQEGRVVGVVTLRDLFEAADVPFAKAATSGPWHRYESALDRSGLTVERAMTASAVTLALGTPIPEAVAMMRGRRINRIPIVDGDGRVRGIVARDDIIEAVARAVAGLRRGDLETERPKRVAAVHLFTAPWPGPGDSEGPVDPEDSVPPAAGPPAIVASPPEDASAVFAAPWPGPGDSEGPVEGSEEPPTLRPSK